MSLTAGSDRFPVDKSLTFACLPSAIALHSEAFPTCLQATYNVKKTGPVNLTVQLLEADKSVIQQRAFSVTCQPGKPSPAHFELLWSQKPLVAGQASDMEVVCKDGYSNLLDKLPGWELWSVFLQQVQNLHFRMSMLVHPLLK